LDFHNAQGAWQVRDLAQGNRVKLLWLQCIGGHGQILQDQFIGALFCTQLFLRGEEGSGDVDAAVLLAQMKAFCFVAVLILKYRGEQVLPAVLLHVVEAALPVKHSEGFTACQGLGQDVVNRPPFFKNIQQGNTIDGSQIMGLAAPVG